MEDVEQAIADREWWERQGELYGLGGLKAYTYRTAANFLLNDVYYQVDTHWLRILKALKHG